MPTRCGGGLVRRSGCPTSPLFCASEEGEVFRGTGVSTSDEVPKEIKFERSPGTSGKSESSVRRARRERRT